VTHDDLDSRLAGVATLADPVRRALYRYVITQPRPVTRHQAAQGVGIAHHVAKFHLDKLVDDGLLEVDYARPPGRRGPGAGRPAKRYRRSSRELAVSLPERRYDLAARLLAAAITQAEKDTMPLSTVLQQVATNAGRTLGEQAQHQADAKATQATRWAAARDVLDEYGYEPLADEHGVTLVNCPFHALAQDYTELVCGMNLALIEGLLAALEIHDLNARLDPTPGQCCVRLQQH
jgi:predicted ArsR family transcriptional regulator